MASHYPPLVEQVIRRKMASGRYESEEQLLLQALNSLDDDEEDDLYSRLFGLICRNPRFSLDDDDKRDLKALQEELKEGLGPIDAAIESLDRGEPLVLPHGAPETLSGRSEFLERLCRKSDAAKKDSEPGNLKAVEEVLESLGVPLDEAYEKVQRKFFDAVEQRVKLKDVYDALGKLRRGHGGQD